MIIYKSYKWSGYGASKGYYVEDEACQLVVSAPNHFQSMTKIVLQAKVFHLGAVVGQQHTHFTHPGSANEW